MYFFILVNSYKNIPTLKYCVNLFSFLDNGIGIFFNFKSAHFNQLDIISDICLRIFSLLSLLR